MFQTEEKWRTARRNNRVLLGVSLIAVFLVPWLSTQTGIDISAITGAVWGVLGVSAVFEFWLYRKPPEPAPEEIEKLERQNTPIMLISTLATWGFLGSFLTATYLGEDHSWFMPIIALGVILLLVALGLLPRLLQHMRVSRVAPELYDERAQDNLNKAYRQSFTLMFQVSFITGLLLMWDVLSIPAEFVAMGIGMVGICAVSLLWCWHDWRDGQ